MQKKLTVIGLGLTLGIMSIFSPALAASKADQVKAAMVLNFAKFTQWPSLGSSFVICYDNGVSYAGTLKSLSGKSVHGKSITVKAGTSASCQIAAVASAASANALRNKAVLTVSDGGGGIINFVSAGSKIKFDVNNSAAKSSKLKISAQLLKLANSVK